MRIEDRCQDLKNGLLDQAVQNVWNSEEPVRPPSGFANRRDVGPVPGWVRAIEQLLSNHLPLFAEDVPANSFRVIPSGPGGTAVRFRTFLPGAFHVGGVDDSVPSEMLELRSRLSSAWPPIPIGLAEVQGSACPGNPSARWQLGKPLYAGDGVEVTGMDLPCKESFGASRLQW